MHLKCGGLSFPATSEEHVAVDYQSGESFTVSQYSRYFKP